MVHAKSGFTLIELIIAVIIVAILASVAAPMMSTMKAKAIATEAMVGLSAIALSAQQYCVEYGAYVTDNYGVCSDDGIFPGLSLRPYGSGYMTPASGGGPPALDGQYFMQDNYTYLGKAQAGHTVPAIECFISPTWWFKAPKVDEAFSTFDNPADYAYIMYYVRTRTFKQYNWSKTGLPEDTPWQ